MKPEDQSDRSDQSDPTDSASATTGGASPGAPAAKRGATVLHGIWRILPSPVLTEIFAQGGMQFQILDCEHGPYDYTTLLPDILACERHGCAAFVRVSGGDKIEVQRCLDLGARGLVFPQLATPADFARAAAMMDYAPSGTRGYNPFVRGSGYGSRPEGARRPWFIPIVETLEAAAAIDEIVRLPRIDLIYVGAYDLSASLGCAGQMDAPDLVALIERIIRACHKAGKPVGAMALNPETGRRLAGNGVQALVHGVDTHRVKQAMSGLVEPVRELRLPVGAAAAVL